MVLGQVMPSKEATTDQMPHQRPMAKAGNVSVLPVMSYSGTKQEARGRSISLHKFPNKQ